MRRGTNARHVVLVVDGSDRGGIARYTGHLVIALRASGVDVSLAAPGELAIGTPSLPGAPWGDQVAGWGTVRRRRAQAAAWTRQALAVRAAVRALRPSVVHFQTPIGGPLQVPLLRWVRRRAVVVRTVHNAVPHERSRAGVRDVASWQRVDHLVVHSEAAAAEVAASGTPVSVIPPDLPAEAPPDRVHARGRLGVEGRVALLLGLIRPYKGVGLLAEAWPSVRARLPDATLVVAGSLLEPFTDLDRLAALDGVDARIGWLDDDEVLAWAAAADVCLLPYAHGAHSAVLHRAVVAGTPVLASPPLAEETRRFRAGSVVALAPAAWADAIVAALETPLPPPVPTPPGAQAAATAALYERLAVRPV